MNYKQDKSKKFIIRQVIIELLKPKMKKRNIESGQRKMTHYLQGRVSKL